ncbi:hypothetical protein GCM10022215_17840 [Nocardioides fonticola]|uniref:Uncharacterized protein n=1 Tax=Nocardioides fonticola TaxID=450363 RepID=A0ABP7XHL0_9ACTN
MRNPLSPVVRFGIHVSGVLAAVLATWVQTHDLGATLTAYAVGTSSLAASRVDFDRRS